MGIAFRVKRITLTLDEIKEVLKNVGGRIHRPIHCANGPDGLLPIGAIQDDNGTVQEGRSHFSFKDAGTTYIADCPWGQPGDELWIAEDFIMVEDIDGFPGAVHYRDWRTKMVPPVDKGMGRMLGGTGDHGWQTAPRMTENLSRIKLKITQIYPLRSESKDNWDWVIGYELAKVDYGFRNRD